MERENLIKYLENLKRKVELEKTFAEFKQVLLECIDNYHKDDEVLLLFKDNVRTFGGILNELSRLHEVFPIYDAMQFAILSLWKEG